MHWTGWWASLPFGHTVVRQFHRTRIHRQFTDYNQSINQNTVHYFYMCVFLSISSLRFPIWTHRKCIFSSEGVRLDCMTIWMPFKMYHIYRIFECQSVMNSKVNSLRFLAHKLIDIDERKWFNFQNCMQKIKSFLCNVILNERLKWTIISRKWGNKHISLCRTAHAKRRQMDSIAIQKFSLPSICTFTYKWFVISLCCECSKKICAMPPNNRHRVYIFFSIRI